MSEVIQWVAIVIEFVGLTLIALELYSPLSSNRLAEALEGVDSDSIPPNGTEEGSRSVAVVITVYVGVWVIGAIAVSIWDPALNLSFNIGMTIFSARRLRVEQMTSRPKRWIRSGFTAMPPSRKNQMSGRRQSVCLSRTASCPGSSTGTGCRCPRPAPPGSRSGPAGR